MKFKIHVKQLSTVGTSVSVVVIVDDDLKGSTSSFFIIPKSIQIDCRKIMRQLIKIYQIDSERDNSRVK